MWESRRDFQRVWEGWKAGFMAFHAFHTLSFPWPVFVRRVLDNASMPSRALHDRMLIPHAAHIGERIGDFALIEGAIRCDRKRYDGPSGFLSAPRHEICGQITKRNVTF